MLVGAVVFRLGRAAGSRGYAAAGRAGADLARQHRVAPPRPDSVRRGARFTAAQDAARLNTPDWLWQSWTKSYGEATARAIAAAHLREAPLDLTLRGDVDGWCGKLRFRSHTLSTQETSANIMPL